MCALPLQKLPVGLLEDVTDINVNVPDINLRVLVILIRHYLKPV